MKRNIKHQKSQKNRLSQHSSSFGRRIKERSILLFFFLITAIGYSQVKAEVDTTNIRIGEQFQYKLSVDETENVIIPKLSLKGFEVVDSTKMDTLKDRLVKKYLLTGFDSGAFYIPQQQIFIRNQAYFTDSLLINVATVAIDTTKVKKFPIKGIKGEPYQFDDFKSYLFWILGILLVVLTALYFAFKRKEESKVVTAKSLLNPHQEALRELSLLDQKQLWQNNKVKQYYSELTEIIRVYLEKELKVPALERTTDYIVESLLDFKESNAIVTEKETILQLKKLLQDADLVKFAKSKPLANEIQGDRNITEYIINNLKPSEAPETIDIEHIKPVTIVQKPAYKKPSIITKIVLILIVLSIIGLTFMGYFQINSANQKYV